MWRRLDTDRRRVIRAFAQLCKPFDWPHSSPALFLKFAGGNLLFFFVRPDEPRLFFLFLFFYVNTNKILC